MAGVTARTPPRVCELCASPPVAYAAPHMNPQEVRDSRQAFAQLFGAPRALVGMVHVGALPGSPSAHHSVEKLVQHAVSEARAYQVAGFTAVAIENMHDRPYLKGGVGPEVTAAMAVIGHEIKREAVEASGLPVLVGSELTPGNLAQYAHAQGFIVGSSIKPAGGWSNPLDPDAVRSLVTAFVALPRS